MIFIITIIVLKKSKRGGQKLEYRELIAESQRYIEANLEESLSLDEMATQFNMSKFYFHRLFSAVMGTSLNQYVLTRKLNQAVIWILETDQSLTDIAYRLNFGNPSSFTRAFKKRYGLSPIRLRKGETDIIVSPPPSIVDRPFKNLNGDVVANFTLENTHHLSLQGIVFQIDWADPDFKEQIHSYAQLVRERVPNFDELPSYMVYSNCKPGTTKFNAIFGVPETFESDLPNVFSVQVPEMFSARFNYRGDLLDISDIFVTDFARALKITPLESQNNEIELVQQFAPGDQAMIDYDIWVPIEHLKEEIQQ